jgi:hypothetical protein
MFKTFTPVCPEQHLKKLEEKSFIKSRRHILQCGHFLRKLFKQCDAFLLGQGKSVETLENKFASGVNPFREATPGTPFICAKTIKN